MQQVAKNKKAFFDYNIHEQYTTGIVLFGSEVKSIRNNDTSIKEAYCIVNDGEVWIKSMHIAPFKHSGPHQNHEPIRDRKLLLNKREIKKLDEKVSQKGFTIIPLSVIINDKGLIKINIGLATGKKLYDKRESLKRKSIELDTKRELNK